MLTIQPKVLSNYRPAFKANEEQKFNLAEMDEDSYESLHGDLKSQKQDFENIINNTEAKMPKFIKKLMKIGVIITTALLGGMATGWGAGKSITGLQKLSKKAPVQSAKNSLKSFGKRVGTMFKSLKTKIKDTAIYKKAAEKTNKFFAENKFGKKLVKVFNKIKDNKVVKSIKNGFKSFIDKIKGVKGETYKKATVNTVGVSGGIASGVNAVKEKSEAEEK